GSLPSPRPVPRVEPRPAARPAVEAGPVPPPRAPRAAWEHPDLRLSAHGAEDELEAADALERELHQVLQGPGAGDLAPAVEREVEGHVGVDQAERGRLGPSHDGEVEH